MSHASQALSHRRLRRRHFFGFIVLGVVLFWGLAWGITAYRFNHRLHQWMEVARQNGTTLQFTEQSIDGTPLSVHIHLDKFLVAQGPSYELRAEEAVLYLDLWDWRIVTAKLRNGIEGKIAGTSFTANGLKFGFERPDNAPINYRETGLTVWLQPLVLTLKTEKPLAFGPTLTEGAFKVRVMGPVPDFTKKDSLTAWNDASGVLEFDRFDIHWGPLTYTANGTIGFDAQLQPEGAFSGRIEGLDNAIDALVSDGTIEKSKETLLRSSLSVLSRPSGITGGSAPIIPISLQGGGLYLGPVRLMALPTIQWD